MPKTKTAKKELRKSTRNRARNLGRKRALKDAVKTARSTSASDPKSVETLAIAYRRIDKLAKVKFIKKSKANRMKSRLAKRVAASAK